MCCSAKPTMHRIRHSHLTPHSGDLLLLSLIAMRKKRASASLQASCPHSSPLHSLNSGLTCLRGTVYWQVSSFEGHERTKPSRERPKHCMSTQELRSSGSPVHTTKRCNRQHSSPQAWGPRERPSHSKQSPAFTSD